MSEHLKDPKYTLDPRGLNHNLLNIIFNVCFFYRDMQITNAQTDIDICVSVCAKSVFVCVFSNSWFDVFECSLFQLHSKSSITFLFVHGRKQILILT